MLNNQVNKEKGSMALLVGSAVAFIYFSWLLAASYGFLDFLSGTFWNAFRVIGELITIPMLIFVVVALILSVTNLIRGHRDLRTWLTFALSFLTAASLIVSTVLQM